MLREIRCDKFLENGLARPPIVFHPGLNVVLGNEHGANSIGKSTFLLIVDFVFGGNDYPQKATDVLRNIKDHRIDFIFEFNNTRYYFSRSTDTFQTVARCNSNFEEQDTINIDDFRDWLAQQYSINQEGLTFRNAVSRFFRIYQRGNLNEKRPLDFVHQNKESEIVIDLEKLFDKYTLIKRAKEILDQATQEKDAYTSASAVKLIPLVSNQKEYKNQKQLLEKHLVEQQQYDNLSNLEGRSTEDLLKLSVIRGELQKLRCQRTRLQSKKRRILSQLNVSQPAFENNFQELRSFFPAINISRVKEIESFHQQLSQILRGELQVELMQVEQELSHIMEQIDKHEKSQFDFDIPNNISIKLLQDYAALDREIHQIRQQLSNYDRLTQLKKDVIAYREKLVNISKPILTEIAISINKQMQEYDNVIYGGEKEPPVFTVDSTKYDFETTNDSGTGTSYKSLIVFDLAILKLTNLPALVHDSLIFKNIGDQPIAKILEIYETFTAKQIFISLDKSSSYNSCTTEEILNRNSVLNLSDNESSLFGRCWSKKKRKED